jgi:multidrug efflux pump
MNISRLFVLRPVATSLLMVALVLVGLVAVRFLPISSLPDVDYPTIQVQTFYPGASPTVMATTVTAPLEVQLGEIPGMQQMTSSSSAGASIITLQFNLSLNLDVAQQNVQEAINASNSLLPTGLPAPPTYAKINPADQPILTLAVTSNSMSLTQLQDVANNRLGAKISEVPGVGLVTPAGGNVPAVRVEADPQKLAGYGLNIDDLRSLIANVNVSQPKGNIDGPPSMATTRLRIRRITSIRSFPIKTGRRCTCAMSPASARPRRIPSRAPGTTSDRPSFSMCSVSPAPM